LNPNSAPEAFFRTQLRARQGAAADVDGIDMKSIGGIPLSNSAMTIEEGSSPDEQGKLALIVCPRVPRQPLLDGNPRNVGKSGASGKPGLLPRLLEKAEYSRADRGTKACAVLHCPRPPASSSSHYSLNHCRPMTEQSGRFVPSEAAQCSSAQGCHLRE
jgi:hypothetical protein